MSDHREAIAEVLHPWLDGAQWCPYRPETLCHNHRRARSLATALLASPALADLLAAERQRGREEALREAAKEAEERGDIGKDGGYEAWTWLRIRAEQVAPDAGGEG